MSYSGDEDVYEDEKFDRDSEVKAAHQSEKKQDDAEDEEYSEDDEQQQFDELKAQIYGNPDEDDDYDVKFEEEEAEAVAAPETMPETTPLPAADKIEKETAAKGPPAPSEKKVVRETAVKAKVSSKSRPTASPEKVPKKAPAPAPAPELKVDEITQKYLSLLNSGKLVKKDIGEKRPETRESSAEGTRGSEDTIRPQSVHESDLRRLVVSSEMEFTPIEFTPIEFTPIELKSREAIEDNRYSKSKAALATTALNKIMVPAPGVYSTSRDRFGRQSVVFDDSGRPSSATPGLGFGTSRRPEHFLVNKDGSPGPVHLPRSDFDSTKQRPRTCSLGKKIEEYLPSNHHRWNPSPLEYPQSGAMSVDGKFVDSRGALVHRFTRGRKLCTSVESLSGMVYISEGHSRIDNAGVFSPSKIYHHQDLRAVRPRSPSFSIAPKNKYGGAFYTSPKLQSPGYPGSGGLQSTTNRGLKVWGDAGTKIGTAPRDYSPERSLNQSPFISKDHAYHSNQLLFSAPVGSYAIKGLESERVKAIPFLGSGPIDRFYDRFELGRVG